MNGLKEMCHGRLVHFVINANYTFLVSMEIKKFAFELQDHSFLSNKIRLSSIISNGKNNKTQL